MPRVCTVRGLGQGITRLNLLFSFRLLTQTIEYRGTQERNRNTQKEKAEKDDSE